MVNSMKKFIKYLFVLLLVFSFITVKADDDDTVIPQNGNQLETQKASIEAYCDDGKEVTGCIFDKSDLYMQSQKATFTVLYDTARGIGLSATVPKGQQLIRGYQTFDGKGNAVFAGCYRYKKNVNEEKDNELGGNGTYFLFQIVSKKGKKCKVVNSFLVPAQGVKRYVAFVSKRQENGTFDGQSSVTGETVATFNGWVAQEDGDCPKVFGYATNVKWWQGGESKYFFSNNTDDFTIKTFSFWGKEETKQGRPGCTVEDVDGKERAQELLNEVLNEIKNTTCPAKIEDMASFSDNLESWYKDIRENNDYRVLWSSGLIDEVTHDSVEVQIEKAISDKITDCQYNICGLNTRQKNRVKNNLGALCKNGCSLTDIIMPKDEANAKCYCCKNSISTTSCTLQWTATNPNNCTEYSNMSSDQCIGTNDDLLCRKCLLTAYEKAELSDKQKSCLSANEIAKELTEDNLKKDNSDAADKDKEKEIEDNKKKREEIFDRLGGGFTYDFEIPSGNLSGCDQILGKNLTALVKTSITILQIIAAVIAIIKGMMVLIPPILAKDADALKKASKTLTTMAIILVIIFLFKPLLRFIGGILDFDVSCII